MKNKLNILSLHMDWTKRDFTFDDILSIHEKLTPHPFVENSLIDIQKHIGIDNHELNETLKASDYEKIKFIFCNEHGFDGNLDFLGKCINLEKIKIGCSCAGVIEDLSPIKNFKKLKYLDLHNHNISDLGPLELIENIEELILWGNPIKTIKPIVHLKKLKSARFSEVLDSEIFELLKNSTSATVNYESTEHETSYTAFWSNGWAFKTAYQKGRANKNRASAEAMMPEEFAIHITKYPTIDYNSFMKEKLNSLGLSLLDKNQELIKEVEYYNEDFKCVCGIFEYKKV